MRQELLYSEAFFRSCTDPSLRSAKQIVPFITQLTACESVVDVGCGLGTWLSVFGQLGMQDFLGIDGPYVTVEDLLIPKDRFMAADLMDPPQLGRTFDLALCLEVAEHIPAGREDALLNFLIELSPVILFSGAVPCQGGTGHVNEQWLEHWVQQFESRGYVAFDCIRARFWNNPEVEWWYSQNAVLYVRKTQAGNYPNLRSLSRADSERPFSIVHPRLLLYKTHELKHMPTKDAWALALRRTWSAIARRVRRNSVRNSQRGVW
jgi:SAM-dependent methyltransferase